MQEAIDFLTGRGAREPRLEAVTLALCGEMLALSGLCADADAGRAQARRALDSGAAAERFAAMVAALDGPRNVLSARFAGLPKARAVVPLPSPADGVIAAADTREIGLAIVTLGGGRRTASDTIDARVGLSHILPLGTRVSAGEPLMQIHAANDEAARAAMTRIARAIRIEPRAPRTSPVVIERL